MSKTPNPRALDRDEADMVEQTKALAERSPAELRDLFQRLAAVDRERFGRAWEPQPPLVGNRCMRHQVSCLVNARGEVMPCVGVTIPLGSIREQRLADILQK